ncbi:unnamed protein product [Cylicocyclus nassatus]|uniref:Uncharacterized protein n=1 Tax=Cylicocyclus nassatus TaxID=53992 RepID=A0AA36HHB4_CYLNA|nr:unnamed protein product [Cylicocyclus nassatus]
MSRRKGCTDRHTTPYNQTSTISVAAECWTSVAAPSRPRPFSPHARSRSAPLPLPVQSRSRIHPSPALKFGTCSRTRPVVNNNPGLLHDNVDGHLA